MNPAEAASFVAGVVCGAVCVTIIFFCFSVPESSWNEVRAKAVELGHAEWVVDPKTGKTTWQWKEPEGGKK